MNKVFILISIFLFIACSSTKERTAKKSYSSFEIFDQVEEDRFSLTVVANEGSVENIDVLVHAGLLFQFNKCLSSSNMFPQLQQQKVDKDQVIMKYSCGDQDIKNKKITSSIIRNICKKKKLNLDLKKMCEGIILQAALYYE